MAAPKYDWKKIKQDHLDGKYKNLKELAKAYDVPYNTMRKKASNWNRDKKNNKTAKYVSDIDMDKTEEILGIEIPEDRSKCSIMMFDKLYVIGMMMLNDASNFFTQEGLPKTKQFLDMTSTIEKIHKGYAECAPKKEENTQLMAYANMLQQLRADRNINTEDN